MAFHLQIKSKVLWLEAGVLWESDHLTELIQIAHHATVIESGFHLERGELNAIRVTHFGLTSNDWLDDIFSSVSLITHL
jgi:hypothetical protein